MTARRRPTFDPRGLTLGEAIEYLGHAQTWLTAERRAVLKAAGFPFPDPLTDRVDRHALDAWMDRRSGLAVDISPAAGGPSPKVNRLREKIANGATFAVRNRDPEARRA